MANHFSPAWVHGTLGVGTALVATTVILVLFRNSFNGYLVLGIWLLCINATSFAYYGYDKFQAVHGGRRVPEIALHLFTVIGGSFGAYLGMMAFCHKTIKGVFRIVFWFMVLMQIVASAGQFTDLSCPEVVPSRS